MSNSKKMTVQFWVGVALAIVGVGLLIASFVVPPVGILSSSVLCGVGEVFTFSGSLIGVDYHYRYKHTVLENEKGSQNDI